MTLPEHILYVAILLVGLAVVYRLFTIPIRLGTTRGLSPRAMRRIRIFTWGGLLTGVLWLIALVLALTGESDAGEDTRP
ncbi:hypothetical protein [uncultured Mailhella sp.]|uniref:hypothetical protein n=1 Tax=uncultured Mailhella sp. TaxID=1981031 RepID=UPI0032093698